MRYRQSHRRVTLLIATALIAVSCYTMQSTRKVKKVTRSEGATKELHAAVFDFVQESLFSYPQIATRVGVHTHQLPSGETMDLDRELPNYSEDVVESRIAALRGYLERLDAKAPAASLARNDKADRALMVAAIEQEIDLLDRRKVHTVNPLVHATALAEAIYYPIALEYAPAPERAADVLGRMHWVPSFVDRAMRVLEHSSDAYNGPAMKINAWTIELIETNLARMVEGDEAATESYNGMKPPVIDSLNKFQQFLQQDLPGKEKRTWRLGGDRYESLFAVAYQGRFTPDEAGEAAKARMDEIREQLYGLLKPVYCESNETDRDVCGPTRAEIEAAKRAEEKRVADEEKKRVAADEKKRKEEERLAKEEEKKAAAEEKKKAAAEEKKKAEDEGKKGKDEKKGGGEIDNPYEEKKPPKKEEKKDGIDNPYAMGTWSIAGARSAGAKAQEGEDAEEERPEEKTEKRTEEKAEEKKPARDKAVSAQTMDRVVGTVLRAMWKAKPESSRADERLRQQIDRSVDRGAAVLAGCTVEGLSVARMPAFLAATHNDMSYSPAPIFQPEQGASVFVTTDKDTVALVDLSRPWMAFAAARYGTPGEHEVYSRAASIESQTRRAIRALFGDRSFVEGWALRAATLSLDAIDAEEDPEAKAVALAAELVAAASAIVDAGLHAKGWDEKKATAYLQERAYQEADAAGVAVERMKLAPLEGAAPFVGLAQWREAEMTAKKRQGKAFTAKGFYADALALGPVPLSMLAELVTTDPDLAPEDDEEPPAEDEGKRRVSIFSAR